MRSNLENRLRGDYNGPKSLSSQLRSILNFSKCTYIQVRMPVFCQYALYV